MKKLFSILLVAMLIVTSLATVAFAADSATVSASSVTAKPGDSVTISFTLSGSEFASYGMQITADPVLTLTGIKQGAASNGAFVGNYKNGIVGFGGTYNCPAGELFTATFKVSSSAKPGKYPVSVKMDFVSDEKQNDLNVSVVAGYVTIECSHSWSAWNTVVPSTCSVQGKAERTCSVCGEVQTKVLPVVAHSWSAWKTVVPATCTTEGKAERVCSVGGEVQTKILPVVAHSWSAWKTVVPATCTTEGKAERACSVCGKTESKALSTVAHAWSDWKTVVPATCTAEGKAERTCSVGGEVETKVLPKVAHEWSDWKVVAEPSCTMEGKSERTCSVCGKVESEVIPALNHSAKEDWSFDDDNHWHECSNGCGHTFDLGAHELEWVITKNPTSTDAGLKHQECPICGYRGADVEIPADPNLDDVPPTGDITPTVIAIVIALLGVLLLVAYMIKRKFAQRQF